MSPSIRSGNMYYEPGTATGEGEKRISLLPSTNYNTEEENYGLQKRTRNTKTEKRYPAQEILVADHEKSIS
ncbi:hypothetical protein VTO73DRAFT_14746 [Trametes versicolor]